MVHASICIRCVLQLREQQPMVHTDGLECCFVRITWH